MFVALVADLFFAARIEQIAQQAGVRVRIVGTAADLGQAIVEAHPTHVLLDLRQTDEAILNLVADVPNVAGFGPHVERDRFQSARAGGVRTVWANSALADRLGPWLLAPRAGE
ncbi:MAG: hypothetical protein M0Z53_07305 [Thermaerobacter sp.]|nr:hypothetical protein [Thermaerobacter sp.]